MSDLFNKKVNLEELILRDVKEAKCNRQLYKYADIILPSDELKDIILQKLKSVSNWRRIYLNTTSIYKIFPFEIIVSIVEYLETKDFETILLLSLSFSNILKKKNKFT